MILHGDYGMTTFDSEWVGGADSAVGLSSLDQNGSADNSPRNQSQAGQEIRFGVGHCLGRGFGLQYKGNRNLGIKLFHHMLVEVEAEEYVEVYSISISNI